MDFIALGATDGVGASCYYIEADGTKLLLDCGKGIIDNRTTYGPNFTHIIPDKIASESEIDAVIISHGHFDHIGYLPEFIEGAGTAPPIYATGITKELAEYLMLDKIAAAEKTKAEKKIRSAASKQNVLNRITAKSFMRAFNIKNLSVTFYQAGHLPGAAMVHIQSKNDGSLLYTGDFSTRPTALLPQIPLPQNIKPDTLLICGLHAKHPKYRAENTLEEAAEAAFNQLYSRRPVFIPARELTKGLETAMYIAEKIKEEGMDFKIFVDDMIYSLATRLESLGTRVTSEHWRRWPSSLEGRKKTGVYIGAGFYQPLFSGCYTADAVFSLHAEYTDCEALIRKLNPKNAVIVHSPPDTKSYSQNGNTILKDTLTDINIVYPAEGQVYTF